MIDIKTIEKKLKVIFVDKAPTLPKWLVKFMVWLTPFVVLLGIVSYIFLICVSLLSFSIASRTWLNIVTYASWTVFYIYAFRYINNYTKKGWKLLFYSTLIGELYALIILISDFTIGLLISNLIWLAINFYVLFQIRASFNN